MVTKIRCATIKADPSRSTYTREEVSEPPADWKRLNELNCESIVTLESRVAQLEAALRPLYQQYVVDMHGENVCDCDTHMPTCAPCLARAALEEQA